jgi:hypothetical protein
VVEVQVDLQQDAPICEDTLIDQASCYIWIFLTKTETPLTDTIKHFFQEHGNTTATSQSAQMKEENYGPVRFFMMFFSTLDTY